MKKVLKWKSWQVFTAMVIIPFLLVALSEFLSFGQSIDDINNLVSTKVAQFIMLISYVGWIWIAGITMFQKDSSIPTYNKYLFNVLIVFFVLITRFIAPYIEENLTLDNQSYVVILRRVTLLSFLFCIYLVSKSIQNIEEQVGMKPRSIFLNFFSIWILPIGIWSIQPRIRAVLSKKKKMEKYDENINSLD
jgi:hypothetical protein